MGQIRGLVGQQGAEAVQAMILNTSKPGAGIVATILGVITLLFGASGVFGQLQDALNTIWEVTPRPDRGVLRILRDRFWSFTIVLGTGFLLLVSLILSATLAGLSTYFQNLVPGLVQLWQFVNFVVSFGIVTLLFALIYRLIPDAKVAWNDVWIGAAVTAFLFSIGRYLIGLYLGSSAIGSAYGAAGSLVIVLVWVYYSAQILLFGADSPRFMQPTMVPAFVRQKMPCLSRKLLDSIKECLDRRVAVGRTPGTLDVDIHDFSLDL